MLTVKQRFGPIGKQEQPGYRATGWIMGSMGPIFFSWVTIDPPNSPPALCALCMQPVKTRFSISPLHTGDVLWEILAQRHEGLFAGITLPGCLCDS